jgi:glutamyl/glutaminyl-tRNA synthetase
VVAGARARQLEEMARLGLVADQILIQSELSTRHQELFERAVATGAVYPCFCSRKEVTEALAGMASAPHRATAVYTGQCRARPAGAAPADYSQPGLAWRFRRVEGGGARDLIIARTAPGLDSRGRPDFQSFVPAYNWACAIDDWDGGYALLVRAADLGDVLEPQRAIQEWVARESGAPVRFPAVFHTALVVTDSGERLEKRTRGVTLPDLEASGVTVESLLARFAESFKLNVAEFAPGKVFGEPRERLTLGKLRLTPG